MADVRSFDFPVADGLTPDDVLARAREQARKAGIALVGDGTQGSFRGAASGSYRVEGRRLCVEVTEKPRFVPWSMVESTLQKLFS